MNLGIVLPGAGVSGSFEPFWDKTAAASVISGIAAGLFFKRHGQFHGDGHAQHEPEFAEPAHLVGHGPADAGRLRGHRDGGYRRYRAQCHWRQRWAVPGGNRRGRVLAMTAINGMNFSSQGYVQAPAFPNWDNNQAWSIGDRCSFVLLPSSYWRDHRHPGCRQRHLRVADRVVYSRRHRLALRGSSRISLQIPSTPSAFMDRRNSRMEKPTSYGRPTTVQGMPAA